MEVFDGVYDGKAVVGGIVGVLDGTFDGICKGEEDGKFDGKADGEIDGIDETPVGELEGVRVVGGCMSAPYPLKKKPVNNELFTYC